MSPITEFSKLCGQTFQCFDGSPFDIPCKETSDSEKLCKNPVVSVQMITYNHEPYIRQAIEGVLMQKTDFEYELVIGEDCSTDKTREICFEYQRLYPEIVRVLWANENVYKKGGNSNRCRARCRGEFIALCEGDDYWTDPLKLQKQVDLIRAKNAIGCVALTTWLYNDGHKRLADYKHKEFVDWRDIRAHYFHTSTYVFRRDAFEKIRLNYPVIYQKLYDVSLMFCMASLGRIALLSEDVSVYRLTGMGVMTGKSARERILLSLEITLLLVEFGPNESRRVQCSQAYQLLGLLLMHEKSDSGRCTLARFRLFLQVYLSVFLRDNYFSPKVWLNSMVFFKRVIGCFITKR